VVDGIPREPEWTCRLSLSPDPDVNGRIIATPEGKTCETHFRVLQTQPAPKGRTLIEARPVTGRTHQIRVHLAESGLSIAGDPLYGNRANDSSGFVNPKWDYPMGLRAISLSFYHPFLHRQTRIEAPADPFLKQFGFSTAGEENPGGRVFNKNIIKK
jgi:23S rRNA-/tRNA-specific pseudouridylate synthase